MEFLQQLYDVLRHLDPQHMRVFIDYCGPWIYVVFFAIIFLETGLVVTPFLPGDSLLFLVGAMAAGGSLHLPALLVLLLVAAVLGDTVNYQIGHFLGPKVLQGQSRRFLKQKYLDQTHEFFEKYGGSTIIIARFVPIVRTFAPFVAGVGAMTYWKFLAYNVIGGMLWVLVVTMAGYWFGTLRFVEENFFLVIIAIIIISMLPGVYEYLRQRRRARQTVKEQP
jgi:membrane-associated protein